MSVLEEICSVARECGEIIKNAPREKMKIESKEGPNNFVTEYDKMIQDILEDKLLKIVPDALFIGEEGHTDKFSEKGRFFIVDPIDGTTNFIKDFHRSCVSIALIEDNRAVLGVIYNPYSDEMFTAEAGKGAFLNGKEIHVSDQPLDNALIIFGTATYYEDCVEDTFRLAQGFMKAGLDLRRSGSAAIDLCNIAAGRAEVFFEMKLCPWDFAAGALIVTEAGGAVTTIDGRKLRYDGKFPVIAMGSGVDKKACYDICKK